MRLRVCIVLASLAGASGSLLLTADLYRRLGEAERAMHGTASGTPVFSMAHVLGNAGLCVMFLAIALLVLADSKQVESQTASEIERVSDDVGVPEAVEAVETLPDHEPAVSDMIEIPIPPPDHPAAPKVPFRPAKNIYIVQAPPPSSAMNSVVDVTEQIETPIALSETEFQRAVVFEKVFQEQGEVPVATPIESESKITEAVAYDPNQPKT
ncbi:MAG: hypothetical protein WCT04_16830 [Planctomycetota bacterium]